MRVIKRNGSEVDFDSNRIKIAVTKANNDVDNGLRETAVALKIGKIKISPSMKNWRKEAGGYVWDVKQEKDAPLKENDHLMDATRYFVKTKRISKVMESYHSPFERRRL